MGHFQTDIESIGKYNESADTLTKGILYSADSFRNIVQFVYDSTEDKNKTKIKKKKCTCSTDSFKLWLGG